MVWTDWIIVILIIYIVSKLSVELGVENHINILNKRIDALHERMDLLRDNIMQRQENDMKMLKEKKYIVDREL